MPMTDGNDRVERGGEEELRESLLDAGWEVDGLDTKATEGEPSTPDADRGRGEAVASTAPVGPIEEGSLQSGSEGEGDAVVEEQRSTLIGVSEPAAGELTPDSPSQSDVQGGPLDEASGIGGVRTAVPAEDQEDLFAAMLDDDAPRVVATRPSAPTTASDVDSSTDAGREVSTAPESPLPTGLGDVEGAVPPGEALAAADGPPEPGPVMDEAAAPAQPEVLDERKDETAGGSAGEMATGVVSEDHGAAAAFSDTAGQLAVPVPLDVIDEPFAAPEAPTAAEAERLGAGDGDDAPAGLLEQPNHVGLPAAEEDPSGAAASVATQAAPDERMDREPETGHESFPQLDPGEGATSGEAAPSTASDLAGPPVDAGSPSESPRPIEAPTSHEGYPAPTGVEEQSVLRSGTADEGALHSLAPTVLGTAHERRISVAGAAAMTLCGIALGALLGFIVGGDEREHPAPAVAPAVVSSSSSSVALEPKAPTLIERVIAGEAGAVAELEGVPPQEQDIEQAVALHEGRRASAGIKLAGFLEELRASPERIGDPAARRRLMEAAAAPETSVLALRAIAETKSATGADMLYELWTGTAERTPVTMLAEALVNTKEVRRAASPALKAMLDLRASSDNDCEGKNEILLRLKSDGDDRSAHLVNRLLRRRGCGADGREDCHPCLRDTPLLKETFYAVRARKGPRF